MPGGRPTVYRPENAEIARHTCMAGATNQILAARFLVSRRTVDNWIATIPEFGEAVRQGREVADLAVVSALFARATGMELKKTKVFCQRGKPITASYTEHLPPDVSACIFWLRNRRPAQWRENRISGQYGAKKLQVPIDTSLAEIAQIAETPRGLHPLGETAKMRNAQVGRGLSRPLTRGPELEAIQTRSTLGACLSSRLH